MAFRSCLLLGRASSSSSSPLTRSLRSCQTQFTLLNLENPVAPCVEFLPIKQFSSAIDNEIASIIENYQPPNDTPKQSFNVSCCGGPIYANGDRVCSTTPEELFPFRMENNNGSLCLVKTTDDGAVKLDVSRDAYEEDTSGNPKIPMTAKIFKRTTATEFETTVEPNVITIHSIKTSTLRPPGRPGNMVDDFGEYLHNKGISVRLTDTLLNYFGKNRKSSST